MLNHKIISLSIISLLLLFIVSCKSKEYMYSHSEEDITNEKKAFPDLSRIANSDTILKKNLYRCRYKEKYIENGNILEVAQLNAESQQENVVKYIQSIRDYQDIYLLQLQSYDKRKKDTLNTFIYFSTKYSLKERDTSMIIEGTKEGFKIIDTICTGFGPSYMGELYTSDFKKLQIIKFYKSLSVKSKKNDTYFRKKCGKIDLWMILDYQNLSDNLAEVLDIKKIVLRSNNKIGGKRGLVIPVDSVMSDPFALRFRYKASYK